MSGKKFLQILLILVFSCQFSNAQAAEIAGVPFNSSMNLGGDPCALVGLGTREVLIFNIYAAGLYMRTPVRSADRVIGVDEPKAMYIHFLHRRASGDTLRKKWIKAFERSVPQPSPSLRNRINRFVGVFDRDALKGDRIAFVYEPSVGTRIIIKQKEIMLIQGRDFMEALFAVWFGPVPSDESLKRDILGGRGLESPAGESSSKLDR